MSTAKSQNATGNRDLIWLTAAAEVRDRAQGKALLSQQFKLSLNVSCGNRDMVKFKVFEKWRVTECLENHKLKRYDSQQMFI